MTGAAALDAIDRILTRDDDADNVLRDVVAALVDNGACVWAGILFAEEGELVLGPEAGTQSPDRRLQVPVLFNDARVADLVVDACVDGALADLRRALSQSEASMTEANLAAASIFEHRGQFQRALAEYQAVVASNPENPGLLLALAHAAEQAGSVTVAIDAYNAVLRLAPGQAEALAALARIQHDKKALEVLGALPSHTTAEDK